MSRKTDGFVPLPIKTLQYNRCPAVAPLGVLEQEDGWNRIGLSLEVVEKHKKQLLEYPDFPEKFVRSLKNAPASLAAKMPKQNYTKAF